MKNLKDLFPCEKPTLKFALNGTYVAGTAEFRCNGFFFGGSEKIPTIQFYVVKDGEYNGTIYRKKQVVYLDTEGNLYKIVYQGM